MIGDESANTDCDPDRQRKLSSQGEGWLCPRCRGTTPALRSTTVCLPVKPIGRPCAGNPHAGSNLSQSQNCTPNDTLATLASCGQQILAQASRRSSIRWSMKERAARLVVWPPANTALSSIEPKSQSSSTRTRPPLCISRRHDPLDVMTVPIPATAAAIAPSLPAILRRPSTRTDAVVPPFRKTSSCSH